MIDYQFEIKPLQDQGISNANIAVHLNSKTAMPLSAESRYVLQDSGAVLVDPVSGEKFGSLISYYSTLQEGDAKNLIAFFLERIYSGQTVDTSAYPRSIQFASVEETLPAELQAVCARLVDEVGGGRPNAGITEADVVASQEVWEAAEAERIAEEERKAAEEAAAREEKRQKEEAERLAQEALAALDQQYWSLHNQFIAPLNDARNTNSADWQTALNNLAANWVE